MSSDDMTVTKKKCEIYKLFFVFTVNHVALIY